MAYKFYNGFNEDVYQIYVIGSVIMTLSYLILNSFKIGIKLSAGMAGPTYRNAGLIFLLIYSLIFFAITDIPLLHSDGIEAARNSFNYGSQRLFLSAHLIDFLLPSLLWLPYSWLREKKNLILSIPLLVLIFFATIYVGRKSGIALYLLTIVLALYLIKNSFNLRLFLLAPIALIVFYGLYGFDINMQLLDSVLMRALVMESSSSYIQFISYSDSVPMGLEILDIPFKGLFGIRDRDLRLETYALIWSNKVSATGMTGNSQGFGPLFLYLAFGKIWPMIFGIISLMYFFVIKLCSDFIKFNPSHVLSFVIAMCLLSMSFSAMGTNVFSVVIIPYGLSVRMWIFTVFIYILYDFKIKST